MRVAMFSTKPYDRRSFEAAQRAVRPRAALSRAAPGRGDRRCWPNGFPAVCLFVNDLCDATTLERLAAGGTRLVALRCAGFNNVDLAAAGRLGIPVVRVPAYSPHAVAEFTVGLILTLNRQIHRAYNRMRDNNFALDGLLGFDLHGKTVGVVGTGKIGALVARTHAPAASAARCWPTTSPRTRRSQHSACRYAADWRSSRPESDIVTLHCPLTPQTRHLIGARPLALIRPGVMLVNTSRGALVDAEAVIEALKSGQDRLPRDRRLRAGGRPVLPGPLQRDHPGRRLPAPAHLPQRAGHRPPGVLHATRR